MATADLASLRNAKLQAFVTALGASAVARIYSGSRPGAGPSAAATGTLLATLTFGTDILAANGGSAGSVTAGVLTTGGYTQTAASHVAGTPGYVRFSTSGGTALRDVDITATVIAGNIQFTGTVATGTNVTGAFTFTDGDV